MTNQPLEPDERAASKEAPVEEPASQQEPDPVQTPERRLWRSSDDRVIAGVCGGLGEYLGVDPVLVRIAAVILVFAGGAGILLYAIGWIAMPEEPELVAGQPVARTEPRERTSGAVLLGFVFVVLGAFFLVDELWPDFLSWQYVWPVVLTAVGLAILLRAKR